ncbi:MAG: hypothetical protein ACYTF7_05550 [Planctomycetota bacterium]|jgi:hypothetical protein
MTMTEGPHTLPEAATALMQQLEPLLSQHDCFKGVIRSDDRVALGAVGSAEPAWYYLSYEDGALWAGLATEDRWLSQSIEADLVHTGDSMVDLIEEELADLGGSTPIPSVDHFRDENLRYTFRTRLPADSSPEDVALVIRAYEAAFRELGDMSESEDD